LRRFDGLLGFFGAGRGHRTEPIAIGWIAYRNQSPVTGIMPLSADEQLAAHQVSVVETGLDALFGEFTDRLNHDDPLAPICGTLAERHRGNRRHADPSPDTRQFAHDWRDAFADDTGPNRVICSRDGREQKKFLRWRKPLPIIVPIVARLLTQGGHWEKTVKLDEFDLKILAALQDDGRLPTSRLAEQVGLTASPTWERVRRLEEAGILRGYHADLAMERLAPLTLIIVPIMLENRRAQDFQRFEQTIDRIPEVVECWAVDGEVDYLLRFAVPSVDAYQALMERLLQAGIGIQRYWSYIVTKPVKPFTGFPVARLLGEQGVGTRTGRSS